MGQERKSNYYNTVYSKKNKYSHPEAPVGYINLWEKTVEMLLPYDNILDLGCGVGQFALYLQQHNFKYYTGIDFSQVAIERAKSFVPSFIFYRMDFFSAKFKKFIGNSFFDIIICMESLEHIEKDIEFLKSLPKKPIIFSMPTFDDKSHVRWFKTERELRLRYKKVIDIEEYYFISSRYHLVKGILK